MESEIVIKRSWSLAWLMSVKKVKPRLHFFERELTAHGRSHDGRAEFKSNSLISSLHFPSYPFSSFNETKWEILGGE